MTSNAAGRGGKAPIGPQAGAQDAGAAARLLQPPRVWQVVTVDEHAVTLRLPPVPLRERGPTPRVRFVAAVGLASLTAALLLVVGRAEPTPQAAAIGTAVALARPASVPVAAPPRESVLASGTIAWPVTADPDIDEVDDGIVILADAPEEEIIIFDDAPAPARGPSRAAGRARAREAAREHLHQAQLARRLGGHEAAKRELEAALAALPSYGPAAAALAELHLEQRNHAAALRYAKRAARAAPRKLDYMLLLGDAHALSGNRKAAREVWRKAAAYGSAVATARLGA